MKNLWQQRSPKQRGCILFLGLVIILASFYSFFVAPAHIKSLHQELQLNRLIFQKLQTADQQFQALSRSQKPAQRITANDLLRYLKTSVQQEQFATSVTLQSNNPAYVLVNFNAPIHIDVLLSWLTKLWLQEGIVVNTASITRTDTTGMVRAELVLNTTA